MHFIFYLLTPEDPYPGVSKHMHLLLTKQSITVELWQQYLDEFMQNEPE